ncbi:hypothetical protein [Streptomyces sp. YIM 132580]|uniref:hypothetical protein n=1 Tax=Streptomyces sp. YIM 132580 TaxID=2691958 RepID=UPI0013703ADB|nr:hypothetical protein [Streptomyces sp. YIM 132580]MXG30189.1 hypothetical protein [Streptomyces sp. YIM 132580]
MTPEQYLIESQRHLEAGRYVEATAYASMATAAAAVPLPQTYSNHARGGEHRTGRQWCGKCFSTKRRFTRGSGDVARPCSCHPGRNSEVRECRYCQASVKRHPSFGKWVDTNGAAACPKAQDETSSASPDLNNDDDWADFLQHVTSFGYPKKDVSWTSDELLERKQEYAASLPVTQYGELPDPRQIDAWLSERVDRPHGGYTVTRVAEVDGVPAWRASAAEPSVPS